MHTRIAQSLILFAAAATLLTGCSVTGTPTADPADVAATAADALEQQVGSRPEMDCGTTTIEIVEGAVVDCVLTDPETGLEYDAPVTISEVDGLDYVVNVQVAAKPNN
ncbi:MAG: DUF4333 domain-containing protein [Salinibacterium sp.]|nr:DUF4333 domain-containing protein [Salinibacterium sp.]